MKRLISLVLCFLMAVNVFQVKAFAEEEQSLEEIIRPQVEAFAKSIDQKNADGKASDALVSWGLSQNGKTLNANESHAFTATLINSELMKFILTKTLGETFELVKDPDKIKKAYCACGYYDTAWYDYKIYENDTRVKYVWHEKYTTPYNSYDESLEWLAGTVECNIEISKNRIENEKIIYDIKITVFDRFDFNTENESTLKNIIGIIGLLFFTPFSWNATADFQIEIPIEKPEENEIFGDMDGSGNVDVSDAYFARLVAAKLVEPTPEQLALCDVDRDGKITAIDANLIRKFAAGIIESLPIR